jgi:NAD(P)H-flavin reductase
MKVRKKEKRDMYQIVAKESLNSTVTKMEIYAPFVAKKARAGQFVILRVNEDGERIPLTVADKNAETGTVTVIFQIVGGTTMLLNQKNVGDELADFVGPLGRPTHVEGLKKVCVVGGGVGTAIALPVAKALKEQGAYVTSIVGFRSKDLVILEKEFQAVSDEFYMMTDDGSYGRKGNVCAPLNELLEKQYIVKLDNQGGKTCHYVANQNSLSQNGTVCLSQNETVPVPKSDTDGPKMGYNNKEDNKEDNNTNLLTNHSLFQGKPRPIQPFGREKVVMMTLHQYANLLRAIGVMPTRRYIAVLERQIRKFSAKAYKDHYQTIIGWARKDGLVTPEGEEILIS